MENIQTILISLASAITACGTIAAAIKKWFINPVIKKIDKLDLHQCRNFLVEFLADVENGIEKDECQIRLACETYDHYRKDLNANSYVKDKWEKLMK